MKLPIVVIVLASASCMLAEDNNEEYADAVQLYSGQHEQRRNTTNDPLKSIDESLKQHTEILEKLRSMVQHNEELITKIVAYLNEGKFEGLNELETHGKIKVYHSNRHSDTENEEIPIIKFGKDIVRYGNLLKTVIMSDITKDPELTVKRNTTAK